MERTEPALVPEWLRSSGNVAGGGNSVHHSDVSSSAHSIQSRSFRGNSEKESLRYLDRSSSSNSRRTSTNNGSAKHPYSSFSRSKNRDREKEKSFSEDIWDLDSSDPLASVLTSRVERSALTRSQSLVYRKPGEPLPRKVEVSQASGNGVLSGSNKHSITQKAVFEKDFPTLGAEEKQGGAGIKRISSPGLTSAVQSLPIGNSGFLGNEKWTSALAEAPAILTNNGTCQSSQQSALTFSKSSSGFPSTAGRNMAEALSQPPARVRTTPRLPDKSQRLEELAIKQSRQLIPMTPSMPKPLVPSSADKSKQPKIALRTNEMSVASRSVHSQSHSSHLANQSRAGQMRSDSSSTSHVGKFLVLKPGRESVISGAKDASSPTGDVNGKLANGQLAVAPSTPTGLRSPSNSRVSALENKAASLSLSSRPTFDKRSSQMLAQSRSEFFNLMRRKTSSAAMNIHSNSSLAASSPNEETSGEKSKEGRAAVSPSSLENVNQMMSNGDRYHVSEEIKSSLDVGDDPLSGNGSIYPDEEEAAFLRSLGWDEHGGEDEGLTEEEINAFYQEYMKRRPSMELHQNSVPTFSALSNPPDSTSAPACSDSSSSESDLEV